MALLLLSLAGCGGTPPRSAAAAPPAEVRVAVARADWQALFDDPARLRGLHVEPVMRQGRLSGVKVYRLGPAAMLGLANGDEVQAVDGRPLAVVVDEVDLAALRAAERVEVALRRAGRPVRLVIEIR